jgi:hypothetical protein
MTTSVQCHDRTSLHSLSVIEGPRRSCHAVCTCYYVGLVSRSQSIVLTSGFRDSRQWHQRDQRSNVTSRDSKSARLAGDTCCQSVPIRANWRLILHAMTTKLGVVAHCH